MYIFVSNILRVSSHIGCNTDLEQVCLHSASLPQLFLVLLVRTCILQPYCYACLGYCSDEDMQSTYSHMTTVGVVMDDHDSDEETFPLPSNGVKPAEHKETKLNPGGCGRCQVLW